MIAINSKNDNFTFFFVSDLKILYDNNAFDKEENILSLLIWRKNHSKLSKYIYTINKIMVYFWDKKLQKIFHLLEVHVTTIKNKQWFDIFSSKMLFFYRTCSK